MSNQWTTGIHHAETLDSVIDTRVPDPHQGIFSKNILGFWLYLMTDCLLFASLFSTYAVLHHRTFGGPTSQDIFSLPLAFAETMILLFSSVTCGLAILASLKNKTGHVMGWLGVSFILGASFVFMELIEFKQLLDEGFSWTVSAFLSSYFFLNFDVVFSDQFIFGSKDFSVSPFSLLSTYAISNIGSSYLFKSNRSWAFKAFLQ